MEDVVFKWKKLRGSDLGKGKLIIKIASAMVSTKQELGKMVA